jgi:hypothetical protein
MDERQTRPRSAGQGLVYPRAAAPQTARLDEQGRLTVPALEPALRCGAARQSYLTQNRMKKIRPVWWSVRNLACSFENLGRGAR